MQDGEVRIQEPELSAGDKLKMNTFDAILDSLISDLKKRSSYQQILNKFGVLIQLIFLNSSELRARAESLRRAYPDDQEISFVGEIAHVQSHRIANGMQHDFPMDSLQFLNKNDSHITFRNADVAYRLLLSIPIAKCNGFLFLKKKKIAPY